MAGDVSQVSGTERGRYAYAVILTAVGVLCGAIPVWAGGPQWKLMYYRQIGKAENANNRTFENFLFRENGSKGASVGLTNASNSGFAIFGNADMNGYVRINTDLNNFYYDIRVYDPGVSTDQSPNFYYQNPPSFYTFETHWLYVSDADKVTVYPQRPVYHYDKVNGINKYLDPGIEEPEGYDGSDAKALVDSLGGASSTEYAQTFIVPPDINRIISAKAFVTKSAGTHLSYRASIHMGGVSGGQLGPQVGPAVTSRELVSGEFLPVCVNWGINQVPVVPGAMYTLRVVSVSGTFNAYATVSKNTNGELYYGPTYTPVPNHDLLAVVVGVRYNDVPADPPVIHRSPASISRSIYRGENLPGESFTVANGGGELLNYSISDNLSWLSVNPTSGVSAGETDNINISYDTAGLSVGQYTGAITITAVGASNSPQTIPVALTVLAPLYAPCDFDQDFDVDMDDFGRFQACISGPGINQTLSSCAGAKLDDDGDVDSADLDKFRQCLSGAGVPVDPDCAQDPSPPALQLD